MFWKYFSSVWELTQNSMGGSPDLETGACAAWAAGAVGAALAATGAAGASLAAAGEGVLAGAGASVAAKEPQDIEMRRSDKDLKDMSGASYGGKSSGIY